MAYKLLAKWQHGVIVNFIESRKNIIRTGRRGIFSTSTKGIRSLEGEAMHSTSWLHFLFIFLFRRKLWSNKILQQMSFARCFSTKIYYITIQFILALSKLYFLALKSVMFLKGKEMNDRRWFKCRRDFQGMRKIQMVCVLF